MRIRYTPIITFTIAILLVGSIAYAADKRKQGKLAASEPKEMSEETLKVELLAVIKDHHIQIPDTKISSSKKTVDIMSEQRSPPTSNLHTQP